MKISKFLFSTLVAAAAMTSTAFAEGTTLYVDSSSESNTETTFKDITSAIKKAESIANGGNVTINLGGEAFSGNEKGPANAELFQTNGTYTFTGGNYVDFAFVDTPRPSAENAGKVDVNIVFDNAKVTAGKFRLDNGSSLTISNSYVDAQVANGASVGWTTFYGDSKISVSNSVIGWYTLVQETESSVIVAGDKDTNYYNIEPYGTHIGDMCYVGSGVMNVDNSTVFTYVTEDSNRLSLGVYDRGLMTFTNSAVYAYTLMVGVGNDNKTVGRDNEIATMVFDSTTLRNSVGESAERIIVGDGGSTAGKLILQNKSIFEKSGAAMTVNSNGYVSVSDSVLKVGSLTNNGNINIENGTLSVKSFSGSGRVVANGEFSFSFDSIEDTRLFVGRHYDENGNKVMHDAPEQRSTVNLYSVSGNGITVVSNIFNFNNTDLTLHDDLTVKIPTSGRNNYLFMSNTEINLNGKDMSVGGSFIMTGVNLVGRGTLTIDGNEGYRNATSCTQEISSSIGKESTLIVKNGPFGFYSDTTIAGAFYGENLSHSINIGVNDQGWDADMKPTGKPWIENVKVAVSGTLDVSGSVLVHGSEVSKYDETIQVGPSSLDVVDGGDVKISGQLKNDGILNIGEGSVLTANVITGTGDVVLAGTINVGESLTTGNLTIVAGATLNIGPMVALFSANSEENSLSFDTLTIVDEEGTLINDNGDLDLSSILSDESTGTSALLSAIKSKASESESESPVVKVQDKNGSVFDVEFTVGENGEISATVVPEPSAFGLLAGLGAIALAVSRRRRSR